MLLTDLEFRFGGRRRHHACTQCFADLDCGEPDAPGGTQDEQCLSWLDRSSVDECVVGRSVGNHESGSVGETHGIRDDKDLVTGDRHEFRVSAHAAEGHDSHPRGDPLDVRADTVHYTRDFRPWNEGEWGFSLIRSGDDQPVGKIDTRRLDRDENLVRCRRGIVNFFELQLIRQPQLDTYVRLHGRSDGTRGGRTKVAHALTANPPVCRVQASSTSILSPSSSA